MTAALSALSDINSMSFQFFGKYKDWLWEIQKIENNKLNIEILDILPKFPDIGYDTKLVVEFSCTPVQFASAVLAAADNVLEVHGIKGYRALWVEHDFPTDLLKLLRKRLKQSETKKDRPK